jgi:Flp pilus assembly protein TadG
MLRKPALRRRQAGTLVESAVVLPITFLLILGLIIGGMGMFRYQMVAHLARLTARYAAVHGGQYAQDNAAAIQAGTLPTVNENYLTQYAASSAVLDTSQMSVSVTITTHSGTYDWDDTTNTNNRSPYSTYTDSSNNNIVAVTNTVTVTISYQWLPELYLTGPITLTSTSVMPMSY